MSWSAQQTSPGALARIRTFSIVLWVLGILSVVVVAIVTAFIGFSDVFQTGVDEPWDDATPVSADYDTGTGVWSSDNGALIMLDSLDFENDRPLVAELVTEDRVVLYRTAEDDLGERPAPYPDYLGGIYPDTPTIIMPADDDVELWVASEGPWELTLTPLDAESIDDAAGGEGNAFLYYDGDATSARAEHVGEGIFFVTVHTRTETDAVIIEDGDINQRISWPPGEPVVIEIEASEGRGRWLIDVEELAGTAPTPSPTQNPAG